LRFLTRSGPAGLVGWTIVIGAIARLIFGGAIDYGIGEAYYVASARHLALSYFDQPPLSLWVTWAASRLFGAGMALAVRLPFIAMFAVTTWLMYRLGERLFGAWAGAWAAVSLNFSMLFTVSIGSWVQPDGPLFLFLLAAALAVVELCFGKPSRPILMWAAAGAAFGLAMLSKYHAALTLLGLLIFVATTPGYRAWFFHRGLVVAIIVAAAIFAPVLIWNWQNEWVSFLFQGQRVGGDGLRFDWLLRSILGQAGLIGVLVWPPMMIAFFQGLAGGPADPRTWFLCCLALIPIVFFTLVAVWAPLDWHFHWQAPGYVFLFPLLGKVVAERLERGHRPTRIWLALNVILLLAIMTFLGTQARFGWVHAILPPGMKEMPYAETNPTRELLRWSGLRDVLIRDGVIPADRLFAVSENWTEIGKVDVEIGDLVPVVCLCGDARNIAFSWDDRAFAGWDALIVGVDGGGRDPASQYGPYFADVRSLTTVEVMLGGAVAQTIRVHLARDYNGQFPVQGRQLAQTPAP
jgi:hypothetical protein